MRKFKGRRGYLVPWMEDSPCHPSNKFLFPPSFHAPYSFTVSQQRIRHDKALSGSIWCVAKL